jgi:hypothetical protein
MSIADLFRALKPYTLSGVAGLLDIRLASIIGFFIFISRLYYSYKLRNTPVEDKIEYYPNGQVKSLSKIYRK